MKFDLVLIIEDEQVAANRLVAMLKKSIVYKSIVILDSVKSVVSWFEANDQPDLAFFDIQLADGTCFEAFTQIKVECPIIFTTAYSQYMQESFKVFSIDYLLKPIDQKDLDRAVHKLSRVMKNIAPESESLYKHLNQLLEMAGQREYKRQYLVKVGERLYKIPVGEIQIFSSEDKCSYLIDSDGKKIIIDFSLEKIEQQVDPKMFFRINRKFLVHQNYVREMLVYSSSRLKLVMENYDSTDLIVARDRVNDFKTWMDR